MPYNINPQTTQDSITEYLRIQYPHVDIIPDGMMDQEEYPPAPGDPLKEINKFQDGSIKPFVVLWFNNPKRSARGRSFASYKLDSRSASVDVVVLARSGTEARTLMNDMIDRLVEFKTEDGGKLHESSSLWGSTRSIDIQNRPTRFGITNRFDFAVGAVKVGP